MTKKSEAILTSKRGSLVDSTFGNVVRAGNDAEVVRLLSEHGLELLISKLSFDIMLDMDTRLTPPSTRKRSSLHRMQSAEVSTNSDNKSHQGSMTVTPFHLALLASHRHIIKSMINKVLEEKDHQIRFQWMEKILASKTTLMIPGNSVRCDKRTSSLEGMNTFHVATRYHPEALEDIFRALNERKWMSNLKYLLEETDSILYRTPLHIAARNPMPGVAR